MSKFIVLEMNLLFEKCSLEDLDILIEISLSTFINAFENSNNPKDFKDYINKAFSKKRLKKELLNPDISFYFVYVDKVLVGYFKLNENAAQNEQFEQASIELERIYVTKEYQGKGIGKLVLYRAIEIAKLKGVHFLWLGVWEHNLSALRFYERHGFEKFSSHPYYVGKDKQTDFLMKLDLV